MTQKPGQPEAVRPRTGARLGSFPPAQNPGAHATRLTFAICCVSLLNILYTGQSVAGPKVDVVVGAKAPELERFAASELVGQFKKLFEAEVKLSDHAPAGDVPLILIGSPVTNPALKPLAATWPKLTDQGHMVRSVKLGDRNAVVVGGGSPVATLWAVYELGHHFGIRYALYGDMYPAEAPVLKLDGIDVLLEPMLSSRTWRITLGEPISPESWGLAEHEHLIQQLAKLKFNRLVLSFAAYQPYVDFEFQGTKKQTGISWPGPTFKVDGDTAGRSAFRGAKVFETPEFAGKKTYDQRVAAAKLRASGILASGRKSGMSTGLEIDPLSFPVEFAAALPNLGRPYPGSVDVRIGAGRKFDDPQLLELVKAQLRAYLTTYPEIDFVSLILSSPMEWADQADEAWKELDAGTGLSKTTTIEDVTAVPDANSVAARTAQSKMMRAKLVILGLVKRLLADKKLGQLPEGRTAKFEVAGIFSGFFPVLDKVLPAGTAAIGSVGLSAEVAAKNHVRLKTAPAKVVPCTLLLPLGRDTSSVLPQMSYAALKTLLDAAQQDGWQGIEMDCTTIAAMDFSAYFVSRASFQAKLTPQQALMDMLTPTLGESSAGRTLKAFEDVELATKLIAQNDIIFGFPSSDVLMQHYNSAEPVPEWWSKAQGLYHAASDELYRVNTRARDGNREFSLYLAREFEYAAEYFNCVSTIRKAGIAKAKGDTETQMSELEKGVESLNTALSALAAVARSNSDRGIIAVLNEYGYRPLKKELEAE